MTTHPDLPDLDIDTEYVPLPPRAAPSQPTAGLELTVKTLQAEVEMLRMCLRDSLELQESILQHWDQTSKAAPMAPPTAPAPLAASTPYAPDPPAKMPHYTDSMTPVHAPNVKATPRPQSDSFDLSNTSKVLAAALHQAKLEPPVFAGDGKIHPEDWLHSVNTYRLSLDLIDAQIIRELPRFLAKEPRKWFGVLNTHVVTWIDFCELFRVVFLPADNQEQIMRGILDRVQRPEEPLPTFVAHMLSEFKKLKSPPSEQEQIELICKHALERYRVALYGTPVKSVIELMLRAHELHSVLGPSTTQPPRAHTNSKPDRETYCFKCSMPGFTSRTCPNCSTASRGPQHSYGPAPESSSAPPTDQSPNTDMARAGNENAVTQAGPFSRKQGNFPGGRTFRRGNPPPGH